MGLRKCWDYCWLTLWFPELRLRNTRVAMALNLCKEEGVLSPKLWEETL